MARRPATKDLGELPRSEDVWEVGMVHATREQQEDLGAVGLLLVVERRSGAIRLAEEVKVGQPLAVVFRGAFAAPEPPTRPSRPPSVAFADAWLQGELGPVLEEAGVLSVLGEAAPAVDDALARLLQAGGAPVAPGIDRDPGAWRAALQDLIRSAPWAVLDDRVSFTFAGGALDRSVANVTGRGGRIPGVVLYATHADRDAVRALSAKRDQRRIFQSTVHLMLEPRSELTEAEVEGCLRKGLQFPPGLYPRVYATSSKGLGPASAEDQDLLLAAIRAIVALCREDLPALAAGAERTLTVGEVQVTGTSHPR